MSQYHQRCDKERKDTNHCEPVPLDGVADADVTLAETVDVGVGVVPPLPAAGEAPLAPGVARTGRAI